MKNEITKLDHYLHCTIAMDIGVLAKNITWEHTRESDFPPPIPSYLFTLLMNIKQVEHKQYPARELSTFLWSIFQSFFSIFIQIQTLLRRNSIQGSMSSNEYQLKRYKYWAGKRSPSIILPCDIFFKIR